MTKVEVLEGMLDLLNEEECWTKFSLHVRWRSGDSYKESYCLVGAMFKVATGDWIWPDNESCLELATVLSDMARRRGYNRYNDPYAPIAEFNNASETVYEDVRQFLKEALELVG